MTSQTFFRVQAADRDVMNLLEDGLISFSWYGPESYDRSGVSVCASLDALAFYLAHSAIPYGLGEWVIVELEGSIIPDADPMDARYGELLVSPTAIVSVRPLDDDFFAKIGEAYDSEEN